MALLIPPEFKRDLSKRSGFLRHGTEFSEKNLKGLFLTPENQEYLGRQLFVFTTLPARIADVLNVGLSKPSRPSGKKGGGWGTGTFVDGKFSPNGTIAPEALRLSEALKKHKSAIMDIIPDLTEEYGSKYYTNDFYEEDYTTNNPIQQLHHLNKKFVLETSQNIIRSPDMVISDYYDINPDTGDKETVEYEFSARSYSDGTWHPEHLFTNSSRHRNNPHWIPREVTFDSNPPRSRMRPVKEQGFAPFEENRTTKKENHKGLTYSSREGYEAFKTTPDYGSVLVDGNMDRGDYGIPAQEYSYDPLLDDPMYGPGPGPGNRYMYDFYGDGGFSKGGLFPAWQYTVNNREYDRHPEEGLRDGGSNDRRVNSARRTGYDMSALISKSTY
jgi:hypothetical protein